MKIFDLHHPGTVDGRRITKNILKQVVQDNLANRDESYPNDWQLLHKNVTVIGWAFAEWEDQGQDKKQMKNPPALLLWKNESGDLRRQMFDHYGMGMRIKEDLPFLDIPQLFVF